MQSRTRLGILAVLAAVATTGCNRVSTPEATPAPAADPAPPLKTIASAKQVMQAITIPASDAVWAIAGEPPKDDAQWLAAENQALALAESANLLMIEGRAVDRGDWLKQSLALRDAAESAVAAIRAKDMDRIAAAGDTLYEVCEACHKQYMKEAATDGQ